MSDHVFQAPKGTRDFFPAEMAARRHVEAAWRSASIDSGFEEIEGPTFEHLELYTVKSGEGIVNELFSFTRAGGESTYALRPEFTPTLARMAAARGSQLPQPIKWFTIPNMFRAERPQRGRLREFVQWNVDLLGAGGPEADAEVISVALLALERLGLTARDVQVRLSHREAVATLLGRLGVVPESLPKAFELLDRRAKMPPAEFAKRAGELGLAADAVARLDAAAGRPIPLAEAPDRVAAALSLPESELTSLLALRERLVALGLAEWCVIDLGIVRGLAYYTGTVFEIHDAGQAERAIAGGGRYDTLVGLFGGPAMPACGFGMGDVVLSLVLAEKGLLGGKEGGTAAFLPRPDAFLISAGDPAAEAALPRLVGELRRAGLHVRHPYKATRNVGKLLGDAAKCRAHAAVILGAEVAEGRAAIKDLASGGQELVPIADLVALLRGRRAAREAGR
jgi:histidyl-tRNA synthetase